jgi:hypothetical protein
VLDCANGYQEKIKEKEESSQSKNAADEEASATATNSH